MKRIGIVLLLVSALTSASQLANAQVSVSVNIGTQPMWGPVGYDRADYYYLPDVEAYYYVPRRQFIYLDAGRWIFAANLPGRHCNYDLYSGYKVVINEPRPYEHFYYHRDHYSRYRNYRDRQVCIRDRGPRYDDRRYDDRYERRSSYRDHDDDRGRGRGHGHGHGHGKGHWKDRD
ncbi:hypothetical protein [Paraflavitalea sp. CAU 1676]|uniref:hypothetical protein n=1 Tax=Paraflavitalea sp. CAU 1676 TaxID=3032598 RepID=UPI0023DB26D1|nr:hypothetical protein [Paraflavitalea sp. CAU 1676]MDF2192552.1 hypothetical protein [Paraflavitalea sp. CAU 1676]